MRKSGRYESCTRKVAPIAYPKMLRSSYSSVPRTPSPVEKPGLQLDVVTGPLHDVDDDVLARLRHVGLAEAHLDAREDAQRRDALLRLAHVARPVRLAHLERDAPADDALARRCRARG